MTKNVYFNDAIIGNGKVTVGLDRKGRILRAYFPTPDFKSQISDMYIAFKIYNELEEEEYIHVCGEEYGTEYEQKYVQDTNILKTNMYILEKDISIVQTDFIPLNENMYIRNYEIKNESNKRIVIYPMLHSGITSSIYENSSSMFMQDAIIHYNHGYSVAIFSKTEIIEKRVNSDIQLEYPIDYFKNFENIEEYVGLSSKSTIKFEKIIIEPNETKEFPVYVYFNENDKKEMSGLEMEIIRAKKINVKDREAEAERYWKRLIEKHVKHDLSKVDLKTAEIYKQSIILLNILKNNETGAVIAALESDEKREHSRRIPDMYGQETYIML